MKKLILIIPFALMLILTSCTEKPKENPVPDKKLAINPDVKIHKVKVIEKQDAGTYSYINVSENGKKYWIAVNKIEAVKGDTLYYSQSMEMKNFESKALNKTFESILFVDNISTPSKPRNIIPHPKIKPETKTKVKINRQKGSISIKQLFENRKSYKGKTVKVEGKVTKVNNSIMGRNWIHIQDGTSYKGKYDLLITSSESVTVGSAVVVEGTVVLDKDFGAGYKYPILVEKGKVLKETKK